MIKLIHGNEYPSTIFSRDKLSYTNLLLPFVQALNTNQKIIGVRAFYRYKKIPRLTCIVNNDYNRQV